MSAEGVRWAMDTETDNGKAVLITVAGSVYGLDGESTPVADYRLFPRTFDSCMVFLCRFAEKYVAYNMDYDARALIKFLPKRCWTELHYKESVRWGKWSVTYKPSKTFTAAHDDGRRVTIYDIAAHFQMSLKQAAKKVLGYDAKADIPKSWYTGMARRLRDPRTRPRVVKYGLKDAEAARDVWLELDRQFRTLGVPAQALAHPVSPGSVAVAYFGEKMDCATTWEGNTIAARAYAGGRIEVYRRGYFPKTWAYDIKSAYPAKLAALPDPRQLEFVRDDCERSDAVYSVYRVVCDIPLDVLHPPIVTWAQSGNLRVFPVGRFPAWVTGPEYKLLRSRGWLSQVTDGAHLCGRRRPWLTEIKRLFLERSKRPELSQAIKLVLNSCYGKLAQQDQNWETARVVSGGAQSYGGRFMHRSSHYGRITNYFVSAYVTALTRLQLFGVLESLGASAILSATDGVLSSQPFPKKQVETGDASLGAWTCSGGPFPAVVVGAGVYSLRTGRATWEDRMRGFRLQRPLVEFLRGRRLTKIMTKSRVAWTLGDFATKSDVEMNKIVDVDRTLDVNFDRKRAWERDWDRADSLLRGNMGSRPLVYLMEEKKSWAYP